MNARFFVMLCAGIALAAKLCCAATTAGTNDVDTFYNFGRFIAEHGLLAQYRATPEFNHTPAVGWFCAGIYRLTGGAGFSFWLRLPGIAADFLTILALLRWRGEKLAPPTWSLALLALSPASFMVCGFHGNVDGVLAFLLLIAAHEAMSERSGWSGLLFGLACQVKIIPLLLAPAFFFFLLARGRGAKFFWVATATILTGWSLPLLANPEIFLRNVLGYSSNWGSWGITQLLRASGSPSFSRLGFLDLSPAQIIITSMLKWLIVSAALALAWSRRNRPAAELPGTLALVFAAFFVFAPGVGAQYLVWFSPLLVLSSPRWFAAITTACSVFLSHFYQTIAGGLPWYHAVSTAELLPNWAPWTLLPWLTFAAFLLTFSVRDLRPAPTA